MFQHILVVMLNSYRNAAVSVNCRAGTVGYLGIVSFSYGRETKPLLRVADEVSVVIISVSSLQCPKYPREGEAQNKRVNALRVSVH